MRGKKLFVLVLCFTAALTEAQTLQTKNVIVVTLDGYRWREVFGGADQKILNREKYVTDTAVISRFWDESHKVRRVKLMPFFWNVIGEQGQLYGNRRYKNKLKLTNMNLYSYAGYSEMFVGFADRRVRNNDPVVNPNYTVLETINNHERYRGKVAAFSTWNIMPYILREKISGIPVNSGEDKAQGKNLTSAEKVLNLVTDDITNPHGDRYDTFTFQYAMEYLKRKKPRLLFISFDETDEHGHGGRYDEYLESAHRADSMIHVLWNWVQSQEEYKDRTTLIIGTDHGRGKSPKGWERHAILFRGSAQVWLAVLGPDTPPSGEMTNAMQLKQNQIAQTIAAFLEVPYVQQKETGEMIRSVFRDQYISEPEVLTLRGGGK